jgi:hypothetical protein
VGGCVCVQPIGWSILLNIVGLYVWCKEWIIYMKLHGTFITLLLYVYIVHQIVVRALCFDLFIF